MVASAVGNPGVDLVWIPGSGAPLGAGISQCRESRASPTAEVAPGSGAVARSRSRGSWQLLDVENLRREGVCPHPGAPRRDRAGSWGARPANPCLLRRCPTTLGTTKWARATWLLQHVTRQMSALREFVLDELTPSTVWVGPWPGCRSPGAAQEAPSLGSGTELAPGCGALLWLWKVDGGDIMATRRRG